MTANLYNFTPGQPGQDPTQQMGYNQYAQQGQNGINPGQAQIAQSSPISAAAASNLAQAFMKSQQQQPLPAQQQPQVGQPSVGPDAPIANLPIAPGMYQSQGALENAQGPLYPSPYAAQQAQPWLSRMADMLTSNSGGGQ